MKNTQAAWSAGKQESEHDAIGLSVDTARGWLEMFGLITLRSEAKPKPSLITLETQLKFA